MTANKEDYLKELYKLGGAEGLVSNKQLAKSLDIAPASVTEMLTKLNRENLVRYEPYKGSALTDEGIRKAITLLRGHRLWEVFLLRHLGYSWSEAHEDAELFEHITPPRLAARLDKFLNYPEHCPHGFTIPDENGHMKDLKLRTLSQLSVGDISHIRQVDEERELLDYLQELGVEIGSKVKVLKIGAYEGPFTLQMVEQKVQISHKAAESIYVDI